MKAVVLAAGEGRRLEPLTNRRPKPMLPVANRPLLEYVIEAVADAGIDEVVLVVGYKRDRIQTYFGDGDDWDVSIEYVVQEKQLGTGHAVLQAEPLVEGDFLVLNGDRIIESDLVHRLRDAHDAEPGAVMAVTRTAEPSDYGVVTLADDRVVEIVEKPHRSRSDVINAGVYGFDASVFDAVRATEHDGSGEYAITGTIQRLIDESTVRAVRYDGLWIDVSHLWDLGRVTGDVLDRRVRMDSGRQESPVGSDGARDDTAVGDDASHGSTVVEDGASVADAVYLGPDVRVGSNATIRRGTAVGDNATVGANVVLENAVVFADAVIEDGAVLRDCVISSNADVGANVTVAGGEADVVVGDIVHEGVALGAVIGDNASVGGGAVLQPGTIVGDDAAVGGGSVVSGRVPPGTEVRRG